MHTRTEDKDGLWDQSAQKKTGGWIANISSSWSTLSLGEMEPRITTMIDRVGEGLNSPSWNLYSVGALVDANVVKSKRDAHLEDLDIFYALLVSTLLIDRTPLRNNLFYVGYREAGEREIVSGVEDDDITTAFDGLGR